MMWRKALRALIWIAIICAVLVGVVAIFVEPWTVPGDDPQFAVSIEPTLSTGDYVLVTRSSGAADGALVRCADPDAPGRFVVGRVIGSGADVIEFANGTLLVNGKTPSSSVACEPPIVHLQNPGTQNDEELSCYMEEFAGSSHPTLRSTKNASKDSKAEVEPTKVFLVSDDRPIHLDSRDFNTVPAASCHRIVFRLWSTGGWGDAKKRLTVLW